MWFFMNTCYLLSGLSFFLLVSAFTQSFFHFRIFSANHPTFIILTSIIYLFTETLVMFFFVGTGVSIKEYTQANHLNTDFHRQSIGIKRRVYPPQLLNMLILMTAFIMVGAVDTHRIPEWLYQIIFGVGIIHYVKAKLIQHNCFKENTNIVLKMSGVKIDQRLKTKDQSL